MEYVIPDPNHKRLGDITGVWTEEGWLYLATLVDIYSRTDRGSQYTSQAYQAVLSHYGIELSMSRKANCWANALMESFFGTLKAEFVDRQKLATHQQAKTVIFEYVEVFYNRQRLHSALG